MVQRRVKRRGNVKRRMAKRKLAPKTVSAVKTIIKRELDKNEETKQIVLAYGQAPLGFSNDAIFTIAPLQSIVLGTSPSGQRVGAQINLKNYFARFTATGALATLNAQFRVMGVWLDKEVTVATISAANAGVVDTDLFHGGFRMVNRLINNKLEHNIVYDRLFNIESKNTNIGMGTFDVKIPFGNKKVTYLGQTGTSVYMKDKNFYLIFMASIPAAATGSATAWQLNMDQIITYTDA